MRVTCVFYALFCFTFPLYHYDRHLDRLLKPYHKLNTITMSDRLKVHSMLPGNENCSSLGPAECGQDDFLEEDSGSEVTLAEGAALFIYSYSMSDLVLRLNHPRRPRECSGHTEFTCHAGTSPNNPPTAAASSSPLSQPRGLGVSSIGILSYSHTLFIKFSC